MKVLITANIDNYIQNRFETLGYSVDVKPEIAREELLQIISDYSGVLALPLTLK